MAVLKTDYVTGNALTAGAVDSTTGINATNDRVNDHTHDGTNTATLPQHPLIVASGFGSTTITGDGTAQNVFTDTFSSTDGDFFRITLRYRMANTAGADTPDFVTKLGSTTIDTSTLTSGGADAYRMMRIMYSTHATGGQGFGFVEQIGNSASTGTAAQNITKNDVDTWANAITGLTVTCDSAVATTTVVKYFYMVERHTPGI